MRKTEVLTVMILMVLVESGLVKEATAHPCGRTFLSALIELVPCTLSVVPFSTLSPNEPCCTAIKTLGAPPSAVAPPRTLVSCFLISRRPVFLSSVAAATTISTEDLKWHELRFFLSSFLPLLCFICLSYFI
ncbi:hypothetical protein F2Q70_00009714 [Brassica cretica]|uniref:Bifunctional inhibitor/plant lipid transfer protein/seed storage helical domain-containing protein n=1 Tax=Brassica cretica TaxID=69181 RepID=A0A8S9LXS2_BRACR|nr:hypothetical protein F2Q70_00009714 [Brassica cretica]